MSDEIETKIAEPQSSWIRAIRAIRAIRVIKVNSTLLCAIFSMILLILFIFAGSYGYRYLIKSNEQLSILTKQSQQQAQQLQLTINAMQKTMHDWIVESSKLKQTNDTLPVATPSNRDNSTGFTLKEKRSAIFILGIILFLVYFINLLFNTIYYFSCEITDWIYWKCRDKSYHQTTDPVADWKNIATLLPGLYQSQSITITQFSMLEKAIDTALIKSTADQYPENPEKIVKRINQSLKNYWDADLVKLYGLLLTENPIKQLARAESWLKNYPNQAVLFLTLGRLSLRCQLWGKARHYFEESLRLEKNTALCLDYEKLLGNLSDSTAAMLIYRDGLLA